MIEVLHVLGSIDAGGVEILLTRFYQYIDRTKFHWNFVVPVDDKHELGLSEGKLKDLGASIYYIPRKVPNFVWHLISFKRVIESKHFDIIHSHVDEFSVFYLAIAKHYGIKHRIAHCHVSHVKRGLIFELISKIVKPFLPLVATNYFACSKDAGKFLFGEKPFFVLHNAINKCNFKYNELKRVELRRKLRILQDEIVIGCVGRFSPPKNHKFLIRIFSELHKLNRKTKLILVGGGDLEKEIRLQIDKESLSDAVIFTGVVPNVGDYLSAFDYFVLPSLFEGLGIVYVEAQASNLVCFAPLENVPHEVKISENLHFISINKTAKEWAKIILATPENTNRGEESTSFIDCNGYNIGKEAKVFQNKYLEILNEN